MVRALAKQRSLLKHLPVELATTCGTSTVGAVVEPAQDKLHLGELLFHHFEEGWIDDPLEPTSGVAGMHLSSARGKPISSTRD